MKLSRGVLADAEARAARLWGADVGRFSVGGATHANQALAMALAEGGDGGRVEVVRAHHARRGELLDVTVAVHAARQDELSARLQVARTRRETHADRGDPPVLHADVGLEGVGSGRDGAVPDGEVERGHASNIVRAPAAGQANAGE